MTEVTPQEQIKRFTTISGKIPYNYAILLQNYDISNHESEYILEYCEWEDFRTKNSYQNSIVKNSDYYLTVKSNYNLNDLQNSIKHFVEKEKEYKFHIDQMNLNYNKIKSPTLSIEEKKACALVLSYYTGFKGNSDRSSRNTNGLIRGQNSFSKTENWYDGKKFYPVIYYLSKAISYLPFYWGYTVRCVEMEKKQIDIYQPGTVVTWLQWSSSKIGNKPAPYFKLRNTWFYIYSYSSREISQFSIYSSEKEALYSPFSHFLVFKREQKNKKNLIYMRQIEIGLFINNILWVDDNIYNSKWENKAIIEKAYSINRSLKIIPKISTNTAIAFLKSFKNFIKNKTVKYKIVTDMNRNNEYPAENAGARFVKFLQQNNFNLEVMIFTSSKESAIEKLNKLNVMINEKIIITTSSLDAVNYLISN